MRETIRGHQRQSEAIRDHQRPSEAIRALAEDSEHLHDGGALVHGGEGGRGPQCNPRAAPYVGKEPTDGRALVGVEDASPLLDLDQISVGDLEQSRQGALGSSGCMHVDARGRAGAR